MMKKLIYPTLFVLLTFVFAKDMTQGELYYNLALYSIGTLESVPTLCDESAINDMQTEWMCAYYPNGYEAFIDAWEQIANSPIVQDNYSLLPLSDWVYFNESDGTVDWYGKAYRLGTNEMIVAYDPSEQGREIFFGTGSLVVAVVSRANGALGITPLENTTANTAIVSESTDIKNWFNCSDFATQKDAIDFFNEKGFSASYDPHNLDADNNGIPCEVPAEVDSESSQCPSGKYWVDAYTRSDGVSVRGHCRKKS